MYKTLQLYCSKLACGVVALGNNGLLTAAVPAISVDGIATVAALGAVPGVSNAVDEATGGML